MLQCPVKMVTLVVWVSLLFSLNEEPLWVKRAWQRVVAPLSQLTTSFCRWRGKVCGKSTYAGRREQVGGSQPIFTSPRHLRIKHKLLNTWKRAHPFSHPFGPHTSRRWSMALANVTRFLHYSTWQNTWMQWWESHRTVLFFLFCIWKSCVH